jgi:hypothetical protein
MFIARFEPIRNVSLLASKLKRLVRRRSRLLDRGDQKVDVRRRIRGVFGLSIRLKDITVDLPDEVNLVSLIVAIPSLESVTWYVKSARSPVRGFLLALSIKRHDWEAGCYESRRSFDFGRRAWI